MTILTGHLLQGCAWDERGDDSEAKVMRDRASALV